MNFDCSNLEESNTNLNFLDKNINSKESYEQPYKSLSGKFKSLGIFYCLNNQKKKENKECLSYYDVFHRRIYYNKNDYIDDFYFNDVSELISYKTNIINENIKRQKIFSKIAHEFKSPLNSILGIISSIKDSELAISLHTRKKLSLVTNLSNYLTFLISDIINYVNITQKAEINLNNTKFMLKDALEHCFKILKALIECNNNKRQNIKCELKIQEGLGNIELDLDELRFKQILLNFISNAVKFTSRGSIILKCKKVINVDRSFIKISVKDSGIGIEENNNQFIALNFQSFLHKKASLKSKCNENDTAALERHFKPGSGLGLSLCRYLSQQMQILLTCKSQVSKGSAFCVSIPENFYSKKSPQTHVNSLTLDCCVSLLPITNDNLAKEILESSKNLSLQLEKNEQKKPYLSLSNLSYLRNSFENEINSTKINHKNKKSKFEKDKCKKNANNVESFSFIFLFINLQIYLINSSYLNYP